MKKLTTTTFIERAKQIHGDKYNYVNAEYVNNRTKICIICPEHGEFWQRPGDHLLGRGCQNCYGNKKMTTDDFIKKVIKVHPEYNYSKIEYDGNKKKVCVICPIHGEFWIRPNDLLSGYGCRKCSNNIKKTTDEFIKQAKQIHGDKYDYSEVEYDGARKKIKIICNCVDKNGNIHGVFLQEPLNHLNGSGCPRCNAGNKSKFEENVGVLLENAGFRVERWKTFDWLKYRKHLFLDFYLPDYNIAIEVQGEQHFVPIERFGGYSDYLLRQQRDIIKKELCDKNNVKLFYIRCNPNIDEIREYINKYKIR